MRYCKDNRLVINNLQVIHGESTQEAYVARISLSAIHQVHPHELQLKIQTMEGIRNVEMVDQGE